MDFTKANEKIKLIKDNISKVVIGKEDVTDLLLTCLLANGHVLLEDVPGTGKTKIAKSLSVSIDSDFSRIQFTPDLLPADIVGINIYSKAEEKFNFISGPVFTNILLADEINRATPRTQSALLESMQEKQVTVDGETRKLEDLFFVIATENPVETTGTFPLPEAELDRFMMKLSIGTLNVEEEYEMLKLYEKNEPLDSVSSVVSKEDILEIRKLVDEVHINPELIKYIASLVGQTRNDSSILSGVSPRGSIALMKASKAYALVNGRDYVLPDDIKKLCIPVLLHRMIFVNRKDRISREQCLNSLLSKVEVPSEDFNN